MELSSMENKVQARNYIEQVWNERRIDRFGEFIAKDVVLHSTEEIMGRETLAQRVAALQDAFPDLNQAIEDEIADGDKVVLRWSMSGTHQGELPGLQATGKEFAISGISIFRHAGGKIVELWVGADNMGMMQQLGAIPTPGQA